MGVFQLAKISNAAIQPIDISWNEDKKCKVIVNFCAPILPEMCENYQQACELWKEEIKKGLCENKEMAR